MKLDYSFQSKTHLYFVMEYCPGGELFYYLRRLGKFKERTVQYFAANILLALEYLHNQMGTVYRDLKPENILIASDGYV